MCIVSFKTETSAQRAKNTLKSFRINSKVVSVDPNLTKRGCSYGLSFSSSVKNEALAILKSRNIDFGEVIGG